MELPFQSSSVRAYHLASFTASFRALSNLAQGSFFLTVSQLVSQWFNPL